MNVLHWAEYVLCFINGVQKCINGFYNCLLTVGHIVVSIIIELFWFCNKVVETSIYVSSILQEDFEIFRCELLVLCTSSVNAVTDFIKTLLNSVNGIYTFFMTSCEAIKSILCICNWLQLKFEKTFTLMVDSLSLIGNVFLYFIDCLREFFSIVTLFEFAKKLKNLLNKIFFNFRQDAFFGLLIVVCLTAIFLKSKFHLKVLKHIKGFVFNIAVAIKCGCKLMLIVIPPIFMVIRRSWKKTTNYLCNYIYRERNFSKLKEDDLKRLLEQEKAEKLCIICMERKRNIMLMHCQHFILCDICVLTILQDAGFCPVCRSNIIDVITVYT